MKTAIVTGITGQDGKHLSRLLLSKDYRVIGTTRSVPAALTKLAGEVEPGVELVELDLSDQQAISDMLKEHRPAELYNLAAFARGSTMWDQPVELSQANGLDVTRLLEAIRHSSMPIRFCQASSSEMFGQAKQSPQNENSSFAPRSPYGAAKLYAHNMISIYRNHHNLFACSAILFNHESPERPTDFVTRKVTQYAAKIKLGLETSLPIGNLEARRDWGYAGDYMKALWMMLQHAQASDYVVATGETQSVAQLCETAFSYLGLDYRDYATTQESDFRHSEDVILVGDNTHLCNTLGWKPELSFQDLIHSMVEHDLQLLKKSI